MKTYLKTVIATALFAGIMMTGSAAFATSNGMQNGLANGYNNTNQKTNPTTANFAVSNQNGKNYGQNVSIENKDINALQQLARSLGIDSTGLSREQLIAAIQDQWQQNSINQPFSFNGQQNDSNNQQCNNGNQQNQQYQQLNGNNQQQYNGFYAITALTQLLDIDIDDLDEEEIIDAILEELDDLSASDLLEAAEAIGIDTADLDEDEIIDAIEEKLEDVGFVCSRNLEQAAALLSIDTSDLDEDEIIEAISDELDSLSVVNLVKLADIFDIDINGLTSSEIVEEIEDVLGDL